MFWTSLALVFTLEIPLNLFPVLKELRDLGNTVVVVEHEEDIIANSDYLIDVGPAAGVHGGEIVFAGEYERIHDEGDRLLDRKIYEWPNEDRAT